MYNITFWILFWVFLLFASATFAQEDEYAIFEPGIISTTNYKEGSPSITKDGNTLVFARYQNYGKKLPYIAKKSEGNWTVERLTFVDTLYNLAISPDGSQIFFKVRKKKDGESVYNTYSVRKESNDSWGTPQKLPGALFKNAGYFRVAGDGTLYMYINAMAGNPKGIYKSELKKDGSYAYPQWLSDAVSPYGSTTYSPVVNSDESKIIVNRAGLRGEMKEKLGPPGLYIHNKHNGQWDTGTRIEGIPYTWYAEILPDNRLIFVKNGDLLAVSMDDLGIDW